MSRRYYRDEDSGAIKKIVTFIVVIALVVATVVLSVVYHENLETFGKNVKAYFTEDKTKNEPTNGTGTGTDEESTETAKNTGFTYDYTTVRYTDGNASAGTIGMQYQASMSLEKMVEVEEKGGYGATTLIYWDDYKALTAEKPLQEAFVEKYETGEWVGHNDKDYIADINRFIPEEGETNTYGATPNINVEGEHRNIMRFSANIGYNSLNIRLVPVFFIIYVDGDKVTFDFAETDYEDIDVSPTMVYLCTKTAMAFGNVCLPYSKECWNLCSLTAQKGWAQAKGIAEADFVASTYYVEYDNSQVLELKVGETGKLPVGLGLGWVANENVCVVYHGDDATDNSYLMNYTIDETGLVTAKKAGTFNCRVRIGGTNTSYINYTIVVTE